MESLKIQLGVLYLEHKRIITNLNRNFEIKHPEYVSVQELNLKTKTSFEKKKLVDFF